MALIIDKDCLSIECITRLLNHYFFLLWKRIKILLKSAKVDLEMSLLNTKMHHHFFWILSKCKFYLVIP